MPRQAFAAEAREAGRLGHPAVVLGSLRRTDRTTGEAEWPHIEDPSLELSRAFERVAEDLEAFATRLTASGQTEAGEIIGASVHIARDPELRQLVDDQVAAGEAVESAIDDVIEHFARILTQLPDPTLAARAADIRAVGRRLIAAVCGGSIRTDEAESARRLILVAREITADDLLVHAATVAGAATVVGGATSHAAIIARSLGVPLIFGADPGILDAPDGTDVLLDVDTGMVVLQPDVDERRMAEEAVATMMSRRAELVAARALPVSTRDGREITVLANVAAAADADVATSMGTAGVGLLRTEMPFLTAQRWPTVAEHVAQLSAVTQRLAGLPVTIRTLDFADDKLPPFLRAGRIGSLGRSLPLMLTEPDAFSRQIQAILSVSSEYRLDVRIMIPMVASAEEISSCRDLVDGVAVRMGVPVPPVGSMIELAEAVVAVDAIAARSDFLSIGTNDLTASVLRLDRRDPSLTTTRVLEPPVLGAVERVVRAGARRGRPVSICGDAASDPSVIPELLRVGCRTLSVAPSMMDEVRAAIRDL